MPDHSIVYCLRYDVHVAKLKEFRLWSKKGRTSASMEQAENDPMGVEYQDDVEDKGLKR